MNNLKKDIFVGVVFSLFCLGTNAQFNIENISNMNQYRDSHAMAGVDDYGVIAIGGNNGDSTIADCEKYDVELDTWTQISSLPVPIQNHTCHGDQPTSYTYHEPLQEHNYIIVFGGRNSEEVLNTTYIYDVESEDWSEGPSLNHSRFNHTSTKLDDGRVLIVGGENTDGVLSSVELYNPEDSSITELAPMTYSRTGHSCALISQNHIIVTGGNNGDSILNSAEMYDLQLNEWQEIAPMNISRDFHSSTTPVYSYCDFGSGNPCGVVVIGGRSIVDTSGVIHALNTAEYYSLCENSWVSVDLLYPKAYHKSMMFHQYLGSDNIVVTGGVEINNDEIIFVTSPVSTIEGNFFCEGPVDEFDCFESIRSSESQTAGRYLPAVAELDGYFYCTGGDQFQEGTGWKTRAHAMFIGIEEEGVNNEISLFPNPAIDKIIIPGLSPGSSWEVYDLEGRKVLEGEGSTVLVEGLVQGNYVIKSSDGKSASFMKL